MKTPQQSSGGRISARDLARRLGVRTGTLAKWRRTGRGPATFMHLSRTLVVYDLQSVVEWERKRAEEAIEYATPPVSPAAHLAANALVCSSCGRPLESRMIEEGARRA